MNKLTLGAIVAVMLLGYGARKKAEKKAADTAEPMVMHPFMIEIVVKKENTTVHFAVKPNEDDAHGIAYEALCSDSTSMKYESFDGDFEHTFKQPGHYKISFRGNLPGISLCGGEHYHLHDVLQWGDIRWMNMEEMFCGCACAHFSANDQPNLSSVTSMKRMFQDASSFNQSLEKWNVSNVKDMSEMFHGARSFNQLLEKWDVSNVTNMSGMFRGARSFNQPLEKWNVSNVKDMSGMFDDAELMAHKPSWLSHKDG